MKVAYFAEARPVCSAFWPSMGHGLLARPLLSVNGKFVNGISHVQYKKGYLCLESEGAEIHFRNMKIMELPPGITSEEQTAPLVK